MNNNLHFLKKIRIFGSSSLLLVQLLVLVNETAGIDYTSHVNTVINPENAKYCMLLLDSNITEDNFFLSLWDNAIIRGAVDGGANIFFDDFDDGTEIMPSFIYGDFNSIADNVRKYYNENKGIDFIQTVDQNETNMYKALQILAKRPNAASNCQNVYVYSEQSQRVDHNEGNKSALFKAAETSDYLSRFNISIISNTNMMWVMSKGKHKIQIPSQISSKKLNCGLVPCAGQCHVKTTGLKWNLNGVIRLGYKISTSNTYDQSVVTVDTDDYILWTMELPF